MKNSHLNAVKRAVFSFVLIMGLMGCCLLWLDRTFPPVLEGKTGSTLVTARDGTPMRAFADDKGVWRYPVTKQEVSPLYLAALITYEDRFFYYHPGVNPFAFIRAFFQNLSAGRIISGGSTLTMQVARLLHPMGRSLKDKFRQMLRAIQLEWYLTKDEILTLYLNLAPFGSNIQGAGTASFTWLGKQVAELSHAEAALLAVLPQAPSFYRPDRHPIRAKKARDKVLDRMVRFRVWTTDVVDAAKQEPVVALRFRAPVAAPLAARRLYSANQNITKIVSSLDFDLQVHVENIIRDYVSHLSEDQSGAVLVVNHNTLEVKAYAGSADFRNDRRKGHVDMVKAIRSPGSVLKPFLYGLAMDEGLIHSHSLLLDTPQFKREYEPGNFSNGFSGPVTVSKALRMSLNVPAVQVLEAYGTQRFHDRLVNAGARLTLSGKPNLSMILGGVGTDLFSMVTLYTSLARKGIAGRPNLLKQAPKEERYLMSPGAAWIIREILFQPMPGFEGIKRLANHVPMAWKTGTSYGFRDAWALGLMGDYVAGVWVGRPDGSPSPGQYGAVTAIPLLQQVFESLPLSDFRTPPPKSVSKQIICWPLGTAKSITNTECFVPYEAWILDQKIPVTLAETHSKFSPLLTTFWIDDMKKRSQPSCGGIEKVTMALWPQSSEPWLPLAWQRINRIPLPSKNCPDLAPLVTGSLHITSVAPESKLRLSTPDGEFPEHLPTMDQAVSKEQTAELKRRPSIELTALGGQGRYHWFLNGKPIAIAKHSKIAYLAMPLPGAYQLAVADEVGNSDIIHFEVMAPVLNE